MDTKAKIGIRLPQNGESLGLPEAGGGKEVSAPRNFGENMTLPTP